MSDELKPEWKARLDNYKGISSIFSPEEIAAMFEDDGTPEICGNPHRLIPVAPPKPKHAFIYYSPETSRITAVCAMPVAELGDTPFIKVTYEQAEGFLDGSVDPARFWVVVDRTTMTPVLIENTEFDIELTRSIDEGFVHLPHHLPRGNKPDCVIRWKKGLRLISVELTKSLYKRLNATPGQPVVVNGVKSLSFYVTPYNEPSFFVRRIDLALSDLFRKQKMSFDVGFAVERPMSFFTRKVFLAYQVKETRSNGHKNV